MKVSRKLIEDDATKKKHAEYRKLAETGMTSALGEYTPKEFIELLDYIEEREKLLQYIIGIGYFYDKKDKSFGAMYSHVYPYEEMRKTE